MMNSEKKNKFRVKKNLKKMVIVFSLLAVLLTGFYRDYKTAEAIAPALDLLGSALAEMSMYLAGLAAGEKREDIVQSNPYFGTEDPRINNARDNYVRECFPSDTFKIKLGFDDDQYYKFLAGMGSIWAKANQIFVKDYCNKIWDALPTDGSSALKPEDIVLDDNNATILQFPNLEPDSDGNEDGDEDENLADNKIVKMFNADELSVSPTIFSLLFTTKFFSAVNQALINQNGTKMEKSLDGTSKECDYSSEWWADNNTIINCLIRTDIIRNYKVSFVSDKLPIDLYIYPLTYNVDSKAYMGLACSGDKSGISVDCSVYIPSGSSGDRSSLPVANANDLNLWFDRVLGVNISMGDMYNIRHVLNGVDKACYADNVINVETEKNFKKFCEYIKSGEYTLPDLLELMETGWKVEIKNKEKQWEGIKNRGKTAKETLTDPQKGTKYKTQNGNVNLDSVDKGVQKQAQPKHGQPLYEFLGDPTKGTDLELQPNPGLNPNPVPGIDPGAGTEGAGSSSPEKVGVVGSAFPDVDSAWWGQNYAPSNDPDAGKNPGVGDGSGDGDKTDDEDDKKRPIVPGYIDGDSSSSNVQWYQRFPFCIPWDIYQFISIFSDEPIKPKWSIPFEIPHYNIHEKIEINFASGNYDNIVKVIRVFLLLSYGAGLALVTRNIIKG